MNIILLGPPGSGKGTQAYRLRETYGMALLTTGEMLREEVRLSTDRGIEIKNAMDKGELVSDKLIIDMIKDHLVQVANKGFILDGFPRTLTQAQAFDEMLTQVGQELDFAIEIRVNTQDLLSRILGRISCKACGEVYHSETRPPKVDGVCDVCGSYQLEKRSDDREETLLKRLQVYSNLTAPLIPYYEGKGKLRVVDGNEPVNHVFEQLNKIMGQPHESSQKSITI